mgnify:CR=1 FL=1
MNVEHVNLHHLRYFWAVASEGNLTRTASRLRVSQSALSSQIRELETQLGLQLFERTGRRLVLTEAGRIALSYAEDIFAKAAQMVATGQTDIGYADAPAAMQLRSRGAPVTIIAHSLGGNISLRYTGIYPENVKKLLEATEARKVGPAKEPMGLKLGALPNGQVLQINVDELNWVDRCESCHVGTREPVTMTRSVGAACSAAACGAT